MSAPSTRVLSVVSLSALIISGCQTPEMKATADSRAAMSAAIAAEPPGDYYIGRRYFKQDYKFWGWVRSPGQPWSTAKLIMMNEQKTLAPDRAQNKLGSDNNNEYKLYGNFTGQTVYEPASNGFYPEFSLNRYELLSITPPSIYRTPGATDPARRIIVQPQ